MRRSFGIEAVDAPSLVLSPRDVRRRRRARAPSQQADLGRLAARLPGRSRRVRRCCRRRGPARGGREPGSRASRLAVAAASRSTSPSGVQTRTGRMRFSVSVPVLSVQIDRCRAERLDRGEPLDERASPGERATPTASESVIVGSRPSGTFATMRPMAKLKESPRGRPATSQPTGRNASPTTTATSAISQATRRTCELERALLRSRTLWDSAAIRPSSVCMPVANTSARASPPRQVVPLKTRSRASISGPVVSIELGRAEDRLRLAGERREVDLDARRRAAGRRPRCGRPRGSPRHRRARGSAPRRPARVPSRTRVAWCGQIAAQRLDRVLGLASPARTRRRR